MTASTRVHPEADHIFEVSWEVCNKVGGINTVIKSKISRMLDIYGNDKYLAIGPYFPDNLQGEFEENPVPENLQEVFTNLASEGIHCHYGKWLIKGHPQTILVDFKDYYANINDIKRDFWENYQVDSLNSPQDYDEPLVWGYCAGRVLEVISSILQKKKSVAHMHEWLAGSALLYLRLKGSDVKTVFTTHATILGRTLASNNVNLYQDIKEINPDAEATKYGINSKFGMERAAAQNADVFTTVSEITGMEAEHFLSRKPDVLLPNGLDMDKFPTFEEASLEHNSMKAKIKEFLSFYFFPYYQFDLDKTLIYFLAGRYEFRDKGIDVFIKALSKLNKQLKKEKSGRTIVAFIWVPAKTYAIDPDLLENKTFFEDIRDALDDQMPLVKLRILSNLLADKRIDETMFTESFTSETKKRLMRFSKTGAPSQSTHQLEHEDIIIKELHASGLMNSKDDPVKVIFYPIYLTGADGLLDLSYYECMQGSHLGVFPSFYEPWGYTPLEAAALGVSSVTTDLAGFGRYILKQTKAKKIPGIFVLERENKSDEKIVNSLSNFMHKFSRFSKTERVKNKLKAKEIAGKADWKNLIMFYVKAHNLALKK